MRRIAKFLNRPASLRYPQIEQILLQLGFEKIEARGSHKKFKHPRLSCDIIIPVHNNDCKQYYKKLVSQEIKKNNLHK